MGPSPGSSDPSESYSAYSMNGQQLPIDPAITGDEEENGGVFWFALTALCLFVVFLLVLMFFAISNTIHDNESTGTDQRNIMGDGGAGAPPPIYVIVPVGPSSAGKNSSTMSAALTKEATTSSLTASPEETETSATMTSPPTVSLTSSPATTPTPQRPLPPGSLLCTLREGFTRSTMQFPPDGLCTIITFFNLIKAPVNTLNPTYNDDFTYFLETARSHQDTEYGIGIDYEFCRDHSRVESFVQEPRAKALFDSLWEQRVYHYGQVHQLIRGQDLQPEVTGNLAQGLQMISSLMNDKKDSVHRPSYTILHFPLLEPAWSRIIARQIRTYPVDIFVAIAHHPEPDYMYSDCHMVPPTITSKRLLRHVVGNAYPVRLGNTIWSLAVDSHHWPPNITFAVTLGMAGRWYRPKYADNLYPSPGNYTLGFPCATDEHAPMGQMVNVTEACIDQRYSSDFKYDFAYKSEFTYNKQEKWLFTYDTARSLRLKLCETKKNMTHLHYTFAAVNIQFEDAKDYCGFGEFPRLRALKALARFFAFNYTSASEEQACLATR
ncbi:uncharacterized protein [Dermacentor albipictus]|uniref:uncharacterized protein isoform X2 n=1 Tax=Dermacentor albipictus TaxID=60249 RepID=UPI0038FD00D7